MSYDLVIIGGGAAGLFAASVSNQLDLVVLEKKDRVGLKLMVSGGGQCNLTHGGYMSHFMGQYGGHKRFVKPALTQFDNRQTIAYFKAIGIECFEREDGKVFPKCLDAKTVVKALSTSITKASKKKIHVETAVVEIIKKKDAFTVITDRGAFDTRHILIATGGKSYPALGSEGDGYRLAKSFGHEIVEPRPGLTGVVSGKISTLDWSGITLNDVELTHVASGQTKLQLGRSEIRSGSGKTYKGDLLFTHFGVSGPVILNNSRVFHKGDHLLVNLVGVTSQALEKSFLEVAGDKLLAYWLNQLKLGDKFKAALLKALQLSGQEKMATLSKLQRKDMLKWLTQYEIIIDELQGFKQAMVTVGGVSTQEVNPKTMASLLLDGVYFAGEVLDVDGDTGGYNLQWAFSSAYVAVKAIEKNVMQS
ncbi:BaiN/RdsA family NAD(P)/FAD-dependent oxidoreductase [Fusibacter ferrireducens]|uniref:Aminoacetone oxidase family FAD-binding enzyme n=1 Tax=Fusibacter ferrireducens TaxID=2785058 RepID=A0ABR9ZXM8_9FIRM|nr:aminoacetone oxidase family FAD-binding enzyme [Fusibacter ferrireducens]MBF4695217.1 aminoacetone oxidase family FAD-binding enzyme [Fusibacter ferrireducens]